MDEPTAAPAASTSEETPTAAAPADSGTPHSPPAGTAELAPDAAADSDSGMGIPNGDGADEHKDDVGVDVLGSPEGGYSTENLNLPEGFKLDEGAAHGLSEVCKELNLSQKRFQRLWSACLRSLNNVRQNNATLSVLNFSRQLRLILTSGRATGSRRSLMRIARSECSIKRLKRSLRSFISTNIRE